MEKEIKILLHINEIARQVSSLNFKNIISSDILQNVTHFHQSLPEYKFTPLVELPQLANFLKINRLWVKDESFRFGGLKAFKILGAIYAIAKALQPIIKFEKQNFTFEQLLSYQDQYHHLTFVTATDGNHGKAVAWTAQKLCCKAIIYMPKQVSQARAQAVQQYGAEVIIVDGNYDDAVKQAAQKAQTQNMILVQDTAWDDYETIPIWIMQGYFTLLTEILTQLENEIPTHIFIQAGVGSLAAALSLFLYDHFGQKRPFFIVVEPSMADCFYQSIQQGQPYIVNGTLDSIMAGLACGEPNKIAWEILHKTADAFMSCPDQVAIRGMRILGNPLQNDSHIIAGESGAVTMGLVYELIKNQNYSALRKKIQLTAASKVLLISTEGDTDPLQYRQFVW